MYFRVETAISPFPPHIRTSYCRKIMEVASDHPDGDAHWEELKGESMRKKRVNFLKENDESEN
jgi:hypothetical protein